MISDGTKSFKTSIDLLKDELLKRGYSLRELPLGYVFYEFTAPSGWRWMTRRAAISYPFVSPVTTQIARHKDLAYAFANFYGVATPQTLYVPEEADKLPAFIRKYAPVVVKPSASFGGHGLTMDVTSLNAAKEAITKAEAYTGTVLVQQQFMGDELRLTVIDGEPVNILFRESPRVVGDGKSTVAALIAAENEIRKNLPNTNLHYPQLGAGLIDEKFLSDERVPADGEIVRLGTSTMVSGGAKVYEVTARTHESYKALAARLADALNAPFVVVDLLVKDFTEPLTEDNYVFLEFNTTPSLRLYNEVRGGQDYDIVSKLADMIDERSKWS